MTFTEAVSYFRLRPLFGISEYLEARDALRAFSQWKRLADLRHCLNPDLTEACWLCCRVGCDDKFVTRSVCNGSGELTMFRSRPLDHEDCVLEIAVMRDLCCTFGIEVDE